MEKIGMCREAHYVKCYRGNSALNHAWCDKYLYAILQEYAVKKGYQGCDSLSDTESVCSTFQELFR